MDHPRAGSSSAGGQPAGATLVVSVEATAPAEAAAGALVAPVAAAAQAPPAWISRPSARLVWLLAVALFLLGCAEAGFALYYMIHPSGTKSCAPTTGDAKAPGRLGLGIVMQLLAAILAVSGPAAPWSLAVYGTVMGSLTAYYLPASDVLWLLVACDGELAVLFWLWYIVVLPAFTIFAAVICFLQSNEARTSMPAGCSED